ERGDEPHALVRLSTEERGDEPHALVRLSTEERGDEPHALVRLSTEERGDEPHALVRLIMSVSAEGPAQAVAHLRFARMGPRKLRRVADAIRGKSVREALVLLKFAGVYAAEPLEKLLRSAVANAENNHDLGGTDLFVTRITVDGGPGGRFTKRLDPRAQGRAAFKRKRLSHVTIAVGPTPPKGAPRKRPGASVAVASLRPARRTSAGAAPAKRTRTRKPKALAAGGTE
ncbi:MAG: 50S ribosomal protein L22, partial [Candidatus Dormibacteria bacterium]